MSFPAAVLSLLSGARLIDRQCGKCSDGVGVGGYCETRRSREVAEGWNSLVGQGMVRGERGGNLQPSGVSFPRDTVTEAVWTSSEPLHFAGEQAPGGKLCVEGLQAGALRPLSHQSRGGPVFLTLKCRRSPPKC